MTVSQTSESHSRRTLMAISVQPADSLRSAIARGEQPRRDYYALSEALNADVIFPDDAERAPFGRFIRRFLGSQTVVMWSAFLHRHAYDYIFTDTEGVGLPLALMMKLTRTPRGRARHTMIAQYLTPLKKNIYLRLGVCSHLDALCVHCSAQAAFAAACGAPISAIYKVPMFADTEFWDAKYTRPADHSDAPMICAAGMEHRDYRTFFSAVRDVDVEVRIAAASAPLNDRSAANGRDKRPNLFNGMETPQNVRINRYSFTELRQLYSSARFVVAPVLETNDSAGLTVILEAMAMGKAVIVSGTQGQTDVIRDRRNGGKGRMPRAWWPGFVDAPGIPKEIGALATGFYVTPEDPVELRQAIQYLLDHPEVADELGRNGRQVVEACFKLEDYVRQYAAIIQGQPQYEEFCASPSHE